MRVQVLPKLMPSCCFPLFSLASPSLSPLRFCHHLLGLLVHEDRDRFLFLNYLSMAPLTLGACGRWDAGRREREVGLAMWTWQLWWRDKFGWREKQQFVTSSVVLLVQK
jgi:hypothetical protein